MNRNELKEIIKRAVIKSVLNYSSKKLNAKKKKFQILDHLMPVERKIRSIVGGLETSMGKTLWEPLAKEIAINNGFKLINKNLESPINKGYALFSTLEGIIHSRSNDDGIYDAKISHTRIKDVCQPYLNNPIPNDQFEKAPRGFGVDIWLEKDGTNFFFDTKTVQPNVGSYKKFLEQVLTWYAYFYAKNPSSKAEARIVFPYNPHKENFWDNTANKGKPLTKNIEAWVENEFWDFLSGHENTFQLIKESFIEIYTERTLEEQLDKIFERYKEKIHPITSSDTNGKP